MSPSSYHSCAVGFSAVLFSLKYVLNATSAGHTNVGGFNVPTRQAAWAELVLISLMSPNASFLGHLCGTSLVILALFLLLRFFLGWRRSLRFLAGSLVR